MIQDGNTVNLGEPCVSQKDRVRERQALERRVSWKDAG